jgi:hypothetical protein
VLAKDLGMLVAEMRATMSAREHLEWYVHYRLQAQREELAVAKAKAKR